MTNNPFDLFDPPNPGLPPSGDAPWGSLALDIPSPPSDPDLAELRITMGNFYARLGRLVSGHKDRDEIIPGISNSHLRQIFLDHGKEMRLTPGQILMEMGETGDAVYWVVDGTLEVHH